MIFPCSFVLSHSDLNVDGMVNFPQALTTGMGKAKERRNPSPHLCEATMSDLDSRSE